MAEPKDTKPKSKLVEIEERTLAFWDKERIFERSIEKTVKGKEFVFYDGPPFATGTPHYGHLLASFIKDVIPRYKTMRGYHVPRRWGWDCHGLPVENLVEKELDLKTKKDIELYGVEKFNAAAQASVSRYAYEWREQIPRIGRWVDMDNDYRTMDAGFTESVWWVFKTLHDKGLIYEGFKSMHVCPRCETTLSNFEVNQGYKDITDLSVYIKFELADAPGTYFLAWTTTPWTLPGNVALAINPDILYVTIEVDGAKVVLAKDLVSPAVFGDKQFKVISETRGIDLVGKKYKPLFPYYDNSGVKNHANGFAVYAAPFVTTTDGTGIVHIAPAFGEDDLNLGREKDLPFIQHVGMDGRMKAEARDFAGLEVKPKSDDEKTRLSTDIAVIRYLQEHGSYFEKKKVTHPYPHCWRCDTPLLNYAASSWFVRVTEFRDELVAANKKVSWVPEDIRDGRFGKWLEGARDWAISRSRYWGAPLPVWRGAKSGRIFVAGSVGELKRLVKRKGNTYTLMRHGESEANTLGISNSRDRDRYHLTDKGRAEAASRAKELAKQGIDVIVGSDFMRTKETARIIADACGIPERDVVYHDLLREFDVGPEREGKPWRETEKHVIAGKEYPGMETPLEVKRRAFKALYEIDKRYEGKRILIVAHGAILNTLFAGLEHEPTIDNLFHDSRRHFQETAEVQRMDFVPLPHNDDFELDLHRPFIDRLECVAPDDGEDLLRVPEVFDCWFESGSMPYGEACYVGKAEEYFDPKGGFFKKKVGFPADFIAEGVDQTRGWFYSMLVLGVGLFGESPFKNVIVNGTILAEDGEKMSKRLKNYPDPMLVVNTYGADSLRYHLISSPVVSAQDMRFSEKGVDEVAKKLLQRLDNVLSFYELYKGEAAPVARIAPDILDEWILARLDETASEVTKWLDLYQLDKAARPLMGFVDDLSTWYLRRSRDRFKSDDASVRAAALSTTRRVLSEFAKVSAPFLPFYAEHLWSKTRLSTDEESVHLASWPEKARIDQPVLDAMAEARKLCSAGLELRMKAKINVRQPLARASIKATLSPEHLGLIRDELNVKAVESQPGLASDIELDTAITPALREEGIIRDVIRAIQDLRKKEGLTVGDKVGLVLDSDERGKELVRKYITDIRRVTLVTGVSYAQLPHAEPLKAEGYSFGLGFKK
ncbi:MAG: class I tRNA ligase family protein [Candidatus Paceibacterota bacterium]|jgi:isoleucyl-tRNA synthetase